MKKLFGLALMILLIALCTAALAVEFPTLDDPGTIYDNDTTQFTFRWSEGDTIGVEFTYRQGDHLVDCADVELAVKNGVATYNLRMDPENHYFPDGTPDYNLCVTWRGFYKDPSTGEEMSTGIIWRYFDIDGSQKTPKPVLNVPKSLEKGKDFKITMPTAQNTVYRAVLTDSQGRETFELAKGVTWKAGTTYTIPGDAIIADDNYTLIVIAGKKRCFSTPSDPYVIKVGKPDTRKPITAYTELQHYARACMILHNNGVIKLKDVNKPEFYKAERPARLRMEWGTFSPLTEVATGVLSYDYYFMTGADAKKMGEYGFPMTLILQEKADPKTSTDDLLGLYGYKKTRKQFCNDLGITLSETKDQVTVSGGVYKLNHKKLTAVFSGASDKNAKKLTIQDTVSANGKTYTVTEIQANACKGMKKLATLTIGANVTKIGKNAFSDCVKLKKITIRCAKMKKSGFGSGCFKNIKAKATFKVPKKMLKKYKEWIIKRGKAPKNSKIKGK